MPDKLVQSYFKITKQRYNLKTVFIPGHEKHQCPAGPYATLRLKSRWKRPCHRDTTVVTRVQAGVQHESVYSLHPDAQQLTQLQQWETEPYLPRLRPDAHCSTAAVRAVDGRHTHRSAAAVRVADGRRTVTLQARKPETYCLKAGHLHRFCHDILC